jgi:putative membrane protein
MGPDFDIQTMLAKKRTLMSTERSRLSIERTFLSWIRTGLAGVGGGVAIMRLLTFQHEAHQMIAQFVGIALIFWGMSIFVLSYLDYHRSSVLLIGEQRFAGSIWTTSILTGTLIVLSLLLLLIIFNGF